MIYSINEKAKKMLEEPSFELFRHAGLLCCCQRIGSGGQINGYVGVSREHDFYGKNYSEKIFIKDIDSVKFNGNWIGLLIASIEQEPIEGVLSIDMVLNAHGGITYSKGELIGIDAELFGELWWFGFDTCHAGDLRPYETEIDKRYPISSDVYRDMEYVVAQTKQLAEQLDSFKDYETKVFEDD